MGHKGLVDNLLYATSMTRKMYLMTMDREIKEFSESRKLDMENVIDHKELFNLIP